MTLAFPSTVAPIVDWGRKPSGGYSHAARRFLHAATADSCTPVRRIPARELRSGHGHARREAEARRRATEERRARRRAGPERTRSWRRRAGQAVALQARLHL